MALRKESKDGFTSPRGVNVIFLTKKAKLQKIDAMTMQERTNVWGLLSRAPELGAVDLGAEPCDVRATQAARSMTRRK
jgi:hypothetical protein